MKRGLLLAVLLGAMAAVRAQGLVGLGTDYPFTSAPLINFSHMSAMNNNAMRNAAGAARERERANLPRAVQRNAQELANVFLPAKRGAMQQAFTQSMDVYETIEARMGWPRNDLEGAIA